VLVAVLTFGCKEEAKDNVVDTYFAAINAAVSVPEVQALIDPAYIESIHQIYTAYQRAKENGFVDEKMYIMNAIDICDVLLTLDLSDKDRKGVESIRAALYVLMLGYD
jgi:hypothetical protein